MLQLALATLLAGSLIAGVPDGEKDPDKANAQQPIESMIVNDHADDDPINDTYALGRTDRIPIKLWVGYSRASDDEFYDAFGEEQELQAGVTAQRAFVGAQINVINFTNFSIGAGGQLTAAQNEISDLNLDSGFTLQSGKVYGVLRGRTLGIHAGYHIDLGPDATELDEGEYTNSDNADALFFGANFDYPSETFRIFAGIDYFNRDFANDESEDFPVEAAQLIVFNAGAGVRISWVEIGAAALLRTNLKKNRISDFNPAAIAFGGGHHGSVAPYLILSPPSLPVSISVKGAVMSEYADYGYSLGGGSDLVTKSGFTVTAALGF